MLATVLGGCQTTGTSNNTGNAPPPSAELQREYNTAFQDMLKEPGNLDTVFKYASLATKVGDLEGAVGAYEGMLILDPDLPRVRLELGILYFRLKSYDVARTNLEAALQSPKLSPEVRKPAELLLAKMPKQQGRGARA